MNTTIVEVFIDEEYDWRLTAVKLLKELVDDISYISYDGGNTFTKYTMPMAETDKGKIRAWFEGNNFNLDELEKLFREKWPDGLPPTKEAIKWFNEFSVEELTNM